MESYIKGIYKRSVFSSATGYHIGILKVKETNDEEMVSFIGKTVTFTGYFHELSQDDMYEMYGEASIHPKYGFQYNVSRYEKIKPTDKEGMILFLASDLFKGIGEKLATAVVEHFGENALQKILEKKEDLYLVKGMTKKKADIIYDTLLQNEESNHIMLYLTELGFSMKDALLIYHTYKSHTITKIEHNIYSLFDEMNLSFLKIDSMRKKLDIQDNDERRLKACILYIMKDLCFKNGDTYLEKEDIYNTFIYYLHIVIEESLFQNLLEELAIEDKIVIEDETYYIKELYEAERNILFSFQQLLSSPKPKIKDLQKNFDILQKTEEISYNEKQKEAILGALKNNLFIITGGPGTGKTTIVKAILDLYIKVHNLTDEEALEKISLLAPTGRASKRMSEGALFKASTIHRFLKWNQETASFGINLFNKADTSFIIIDEASMIDLELLNHLMNGLKRHIQLILVGDDNQLPSVGPGQILKDLIDSKVVPVVCLDQLYRREEGSYITDLAYEIKSNTLSSFMEKKKDYQFMECNSTQVSVFLPKICAKIAAKGYDYKRLQIMAPMYKGINGIDVLNQKLQEVLNPVSSEKEEISFENVIYRENDKILELVNVPEENIFNGDIGTICKIVKASHSESKKNEIYVDFDGNVVKFLPKDMYKISHGFIISIHKAQGSEFDFVVLPLTSAYHRMLYRKLIYTAVTRAKKKLILIGEKESFIKAVENNKEYIRKTKFCEKLRNKCINL